MIYIVHTGLGKAFKGTVVNRALPSLYGGLLEIILIFSSKDLVNSKEILKVPNQYYYFRSG